VSIVADASVVVAALTEAGPTGRWADTLLAGEPLLAPHHMPVEVADVLRRAVPIGRLSADAATLAHQDLLRLRVTLVPYARFADRIWQLRPSVSAYDAWYVALAEHLSAPMATLDRRLSRAPGPTCQFLTPPEGG